MKQISLFVIGLHVIFLIWMAIWIPVKKTERKPLEIQTIIETPPPPPAYSSPPPLLTQSTAPAQKKPAPVKPPPKPTPSLKPKPKSLPKKIASTPSKTPTISPSLLKQLQQNMQAIEKSTLKQTSSLQSKIPQALHLQIDALTDPKASHYTSLLIEFLQSKLQLPEQGSVKMELALKKDGTLFALKVLQSGSEKNKLFLERELKSLTFPPFQEELKENQEYTFVITFYST